MVRKIHLADISLAGIRKLLVRPGIRNTSVPMIPRAGAAIVNASCCVPAATDSFEGSTIRRLGTACVDPDTHETAAQTTSRRQPATILPAIILNRLKANPSKLRTHSNHLNRPGRITSSFETRSGAERSTGTSPTSIADPGV